MPTNTPAPPDQTLQHEQTLPNDEDLEQTSPEQQLEKEWNRIHQIHALSSPWCETRFTTYLTVDATDPTTDDDNDIPTNEEDDTPQINYPMSQKEAKRLHREMEQQVRQEESEVFLLQTIEDAAPERRRLLGLAQRRHKRQHRRNKHAETAREKCKVMRIEATRQLDVYKKSEERIKNLNRKLVQLKEMAANALKHYDSLPDDTERENVHVLGDVHTEPFKINRGTNKSARATEPF